MKAWRGEGKTHMYFWFLFKVRSLGTRAMILESQKLQKVFDALEYFDPVDKRMAARSPTVLITDARGFHDIICHIEQRMTATGVRVWD